MKFERPSLSTIFVFLCIGSLVLISSKEINISIALTSISLALLVFPLTLLGIFAIPNVRKSIKKYYLDQRSYIQEDIGALRKKQEKIKDPNKLIEIDEEILNARSGLLNFQDNRFGKGIVLGIMFLIVTLLIFYLNLGNYLDINNQMLGVVFFFSGTYWIAESIETLIYAFD